jgi:hypothetical protein
MELITKLPADAASGSPAQLVVGSLDINQGTHIHSVQCQSIYMTGFAVVLCCVSDQNRLPTTWSYPQSCQQMRRQAALLSWWLAA